MTLSSFKTLGKWLAKIDPLNFTTVRIEPYFDDKKLGDATGFFYFGILNEQPNHWLVTNWHVLAGRNALDPSKVLHSQGSLPNKLRLSLVINGDQPEYGAKNDEILFQEQVIDLYDSQGMAVWLQHPTEKHNIDVGVINGSVFAGRFYLVGINEVAKQNDMAIQIANNIFILGYPLGFSHFMKTPIWKKGSIASEPHSETTESKGRVVIDATTRQGMSGAPVIMREKTHYISENGKIIKHADATRFVGIYSSRPNLQPAGNGLEEDRRAEVGYFYKSGNVEYVIKNGIRGPRLGELP